VTRTLLALAAIVSTCATPAAHAQIPPDYEVRELERGDAEVIQAARPFANCLVAQKAKEIPKYLGIMSYKTEWIAREMSKAHPDCPAPKKLGRSVRMILQGALLEALIRRDFGNVAPPSNFSHMPPFLYVKDTDNELSKESFANLIEPYDCVSRREPAKVRALFATRPLSADEEVALAALKPALVGCQPKGEKWELRGYFVRRFLAETYYTLMKVDQRRKASAH
jgi:hypothetical protein